MAVAVPALYIGHIGVVSFSMAFVCILIAEEALFLLWRSTNLP